MKNAEKYSKIRKENSSFSNAPSKNTARDMLVKIIGEGKFPPLLRRIIQFYLRNVAVFKARVLDNNRITIPKEEVDILGIEPGDYVAVILTKIEPEKEAEQA